MSGSASVLAATVVDLNHNMAFAVTTWAEQTGDKLFLGEFGAGQDAAALTRGRLTVRLTSA